MFPGLAVTAAMVSQQQAGGQNGSLPQPAAAVPPAGMLNLVALAFPRSYCRRQLVHPACHSSVSYTHLTLPTKA